MSDRWDYDSMFIDGAWTPPANGRSIAHVVGASRTNGGIADLGHQGARLNTAIQKMNRARPIDEREDAQADRDPCCQLPVRNVARTSLTVSADGRGGGRVASRPSGGV